MNRLLTVKALADDAVRLLRSSAPDRAEIAETLILLLERAIGASNLVIASLSARTH